MSTCPKCQGTNTGVIMTRKLRNGWVKRWRACLSPECKHMVRTIEIPEDELDLDPSDPGMMHVQRKK